MAMPGSNRLLPEPPKRTVLLKLLTHFQNVLHCVLIASAAVTATLQHWLVTGVILAPFVANAVIGFVQEGRGAYAA